MTKLFFDDADFDGQLQRTMSAAYVGSADLGEALATAQRIKPGDPVSWFDCWSDLAGRVEATAQEQATRGHRANAANNWLRASEYWRQSFFFIRHDIDDPRLQKAWRAHRAAFRAWLALCDFPTTTGAIPFDGAQMTAYLMRPIGPVKPQPTLIIPAGFDSTAENGYCATGFMALAHDMNALIWEGPGQGGVLFMKTSCRCGLISKPCCHRSLTGFSRRTASIRNRSFSLAAALPVVSRRAPQLMRSV